MAVSTLALGTARVNRVEVHSVVVTAEVEMARTRGSRPVTSWMHTDTAGHFHAYGPDGGLPTLRAVDTHIPCDGLCAVRGGCEGYGERSYRCLICDAPVVPATVAGGDTMVPVDTRYFAAVQGPEGLAHLDGESVTLMGGGFFSLGTLTVRERRWESGLLLTSADIALAGWWPIGGRAVAGAPKFATDDERSQAERDAALRAALARVTTALREAMAQAGMGSEEVS
jgi:hypothetical protein